MVWWSNNGTAHRSWIGVPFLIPDSLPTLTTDQTDYAPEQTVNVSGTGFDPSADYAIPVMRPDGTMVHGDGTFTPGWDLATSDGTGNLAYSYQLDGVQGIYEVRAYAADCVALTGCCKRRSMCSCSSSVPTTDCADSPRTP